MNTAFYNSLVTNPQKFRDNFRQKISTLYELPEKDAANIETSTYNWALKEASILKIVKKWENKNFAQIYIDRLRSIFINLKNTEFLYRVKSHEILPQKVGFLSHQEICPEIWQELIEQKMKRDQSRGQQTICASTSMFTCRKCFSKECTYYELQTRSCDEPTSIFVSCLKCGKHWRQ